MAGVGLTEDALEDLRDLERSIQKQVLKGLLKLEDNPAQRGLPLGSKGTSNLTTFRKLIVGDRDYRIIFRVEQDGSASVVWVIGKRDDSEAYELADARLRLHGDAPVRELAQALRELWVTHPRASE